MIREKTWTFSVAQTLVGVSPIVSTNDVDLKTSELIAGVAGFRDMGIGPRPLYIVCQLTATMVGAGATVTVNLQQSATAAAGAYTKIQELDIFPALAATGTDGGYIVCPIAPRNITQNYLSLSYVITGVLTAGAVTSFMTPDIQAYVGYRKNYTISTS